MDNNINNNEDHNGGRDNLRGNWERRILWAISFLAMGGTLLGVHLTWLHYEIRAHEGKNYCTYSELWSCDEVTRSEYAEIAGIPIALIGLVGFLVLFAIAYIRVLSIKKEATELMSFAIVLVACAGFAISLYLTLVELFIIEAICAECFLSFLIILTSLILSILLVPIWLGERNARRWERYRNREKPEVVMSRG